MADEIHFTITASKPNQGDIDRPALNAAVEPHALDVLRAIVGQGFDPADVKLTTNIHDETDGESTAAELLADDPAPEGES